MSNYRLDLKVAPSLSYSDLDLSRAEGRVAAARKVKSVLKILLSVPFVVCVLYVGSVLYNRARVAPQGVETVQDFYQRYGNPPRVDTLFVEGHKYYRVTGDIPAPLGFPKGPPIYIFDMTGRLIDWTSESQADLHFSARWDDAPAEEMSVGYFLDKFTRN